MGAVPVCPFLGRGAGSPSNRMWSGEGSWVFIWHNVAWAEAYLRAKCHLDPSSRLATITIGRKLGALPPFCRGGTGSPSGTMWPGPRPTSLPSGMLIHPAIWPQQIWPKIGGCAPLGRGAGSPYLTECGQGRGLPSRQVSC